jgi:2-keto-4-pentenoate hydratase/2-oxohepta-3-ene-1,7-dioic acid hydratase in catechol pathway
MKIALFNENRLGVVNGEHIVDISELAAWNPADAQRSLERFMADFDTLRPKIESGLHSLPGCPLSDVTLRAPIPNPSKIIAAPINYMLHKEEMNTALTVDGLGFFLKSPSSIIGPNETVLLPYKDRRVDHEAEIAYVVGKNAKDVPASEAHKYIFGYIALMDITIRGKEDRPWRKSHDTFTPIGPWIVTGDEMGDPNNVQMNLWVNGEVRQSANTSDLIYDCFRFFEVASRAMTLFPGDIITTGTPEGVAPIVKGDNVRIHIERIGEFTVHVDYKQGI